MPLPNRGQPARISAIVPPPPTDGHVVTNGAARAVEGWPEPFLGGFNLEKIVEAKPELLELAARDSRERVA